MNRDHVPSKALLTRPYPPNLPVIPVCAGCNDSFSRDEEYFTTLLACVLSGSTEPAQQSDPRAARALSRSPALQRRIACAKVEREAFDGSRQKFWAPENERINPLIVKNARGHALYEYGEPIIAEPHHVWSAPLPLLTEDERFTFECWNQDGLLPEVGSRMLTRVLTGQDLVDGWVKIQKGSYRYLVVRHGLMLVRSVIADYLATEVYWRDD